MSASETGSEAAGDAGHTKYAAMKAADDLLKRIGELDTKGALAAKQAKILTDVTINLSR